jgi:hypothetical protein
MAKWDLSVIPPNATQRVASQNLHDVTNGRPTGLFRSPTF